MWIFLATSEVKMEVAASPKFVHSRRVTRNPLYADASSAFVRTRRSIEMPVLTTIEIRW